MRFFLRVIMQGKRGFTVMEIMVVMVIMGIFAAMAYPYYIAQKKRSYRIGVQTALLAEMHKAIYHANINRSYEYAGIATYDWPITQTKAYMVSGSRPTLDVTNQAYILIAKPNDRGFMVNDGWICINNKLERSWQPGVNACALSATSTWYGE